MSILKLKDSQGNWIGVPTIKGDKGDKGDGISSAVLNNDYTLTLTFTDGTTYTTPSIRGEKGEQGEPATDMNIHICSSNEYDSETRVPTITSPDDKTFYLVPTEDGTSPDLFTEWVYVNNAWEMFGSASVDLSGYLTDVTVDGTSTVTDGVAEIPIANSLRLGVVKANYLNGISVKNDGNLIIYPAGSSSIKNGTNENYPLNAKRQHESTFYGLAKASGTDEKDSTLPVGQYTDEAKASIQSMLGVPSEDEVVTDVQVNGTSVVTDGVAEIPVGSSSELGVYKIGAGLFKNNANALSIDFGGSAQIKASSSSARAIGTNLQHESAFYGLAKASGTDEKNSTLPVGQYTDEAKASIQNMLDVPSNADLNEVEEKVDQNTEDLLKAFPIESASGGIASFEDGADDMPLQSLVVDINPVQDLHEQDAPYPAGGGKNLFPEKTLSLGKPDTRTKTVYFDISIPAGEYVMSFTKGGTYTGGWGIGLYAGSTPVGTVNVSTGRVTINDTPERAYFYMPQTSYDDGLTIELDNIQLELGSTATSYAPYSNICPISGWTQVDVEQSGKNLLDVDDFTLIKSSSRTKGIILPIKFGIGTYTLSVTVTENTTTKATQISVRGTKTPPYVSVGSLAIPSGTTGTLTTEFTATVPFEYIYAYIANSDDDTATFTITDIQLEIGSTATGYEPYTGRSITIDLGQTVYGGKLDVLSGELVVDRAFALLDGTQAIKWADWRTTETSTAWQYEPDIFGEKKVEKNVVPNILSDRLKTLTYNQLYGGAYDNGIGVNANANYGLIVRVADPSLTTVSAINAYLSTNPIQVCCELAEPQTYQLTPHEVNSLLGINNIWADTGDTACEYRADPDLYIQRKMPEVPVDDVQINGQSIVTDGVANIPVVTPNGSVTLGLVRPQVGLGTAVASNGGLAVVKANASQVKAGTNEYAPIVPQFQHQSTFYGLAKAAGDTTQSQSSNAVGNYTDNAKDKIQTMLGVSPLIAPHESDPFESAHAIGELFIINGKLYRAKTALTAGEYINEGTNVEVVDIAEVLDNTYVKNTDYATANTAGVVKTNGNYGVQIYAGQLQILHALDSHIKTGSGSLAPYRPITPDQQHQSVFYGLAKAAGDTTQSLSNNALGTYTDEAKIAIKTMLGVHDTYDSFIEEVTGTDVTITGQPSYRYNCGEVLSLSITPPSSGTIDFRFTSGSTPTVLTLPQTVKMPEWWVEVEANTIYEMCITDGIYCGVMTWAM